jgi:hypothetical protein
MLIKKQVPNIRNSSMALAVVNADERYSAAASNDIKKPQANVLRLFGA